MFNVGFDLDNVISKTAEGVLSALAAKGKIPANTGIDKCTCWAFEYNPETKTGFSGVTKEDITQIFMDPSFWGTLTPNKDTVAAMELLYNHLPGQLYIITDRFWFPEIGDITRMWLKAHAVPFDELIITPGSKKWEACAKNKICFFVDDNIDNIQSIAKYVPCAYLYGKPWNAGASLPENAVRCEDIHHITGDIALYNQIEKQRARLSQFESMTLLHEKVSGVTRSNSVLIDGSRIWRTENAA